MGSRRERLDEPREPQNGPQVTPAPAPEAPVAAPAAGLSVGLVAALARTHGNAIVSRAVAGRTLARMPVADAKKAVEDAAGGLGTDEDGIYDAIRNCDDRATLAPLIRSILVDELSGFELWKAELLLAHGPEARWPAGLAEVFAACEGAGTDEGRIFNALNALTPVQAAALGKVPGLRRILEDELSGFDLKRVNLMLKYGGEASWAKGLKEVLASTEGAGTDEARLYRALSQLTEAEAQALAKVDGVMALIEDELSGDELQAAKDYLSGAYARAIAAHKANVTALTNHITAWRGSGTLRPIELNTLDFLFPTAGRPRARSHVITSTHDGAARAKHHGHDGDIAYFGTDHDYPDASATYDADVTSARDVSFSGPGVVGEQSAGRVWIMDVTSHTATDIMGTLVHELQHFADKHDDEEDWKKDYKSPEESWARYKTEFRAWWVEDYFVSSSDVKGSAAAPWDNARQKAIFDHFMASASYSEFVKPNYDGNTDVHGQKFKDLVHGYTHPEGINLINSPRIDDFYGALKKTGPADEDPAKSPLSGVMAAVTGLDAGDLAYVNSARAKSLQDMMRDRLSASAFAAVAVKLGSPGWAAVNIAPARRAILAAGKGAGTDEQAMYDAIANATDAERAEMAKDPVIQAELADELSGKDLWRAQQYLKYGPKAKWPKDVAEKDT